jgi:hypothetical protein
MKVLRTIAVALLALIFIAGIVFSIWYTPRREQALFACIPAEADLVSIHRGAAARLEGLMENALFASLIESTGLRRAQIAALLAAPQSRIWLDRIAAHDLLLAHLPNQGFAGTPAWGLAAWLGPDSLRLRWSIGISAPPEARLGTVAGTEIWQFELSDLPPGQRLYCALGEGLFLATIAPSADSIHQMVLCYQGRALSLADTRPALAGGQPSDLDHYPDQLLYFTGRANPAAVQARFSSIRERGLSGLLSFPKTGAAQSPAPAAPSARPRIEWRQPLLQAAFGRDTLRGVALEFADNPLGMIALALAEEAQSGPLYIGLFGDDKQGRMKGFRIPGLLAALPVADQELARELMLERIDRINAVYSLGLIHTRSQLADSFIYRVAGTRDNLYGELPAEEQAAFMLRDGFLLIGSHPLLLEQIASDSFGTAPEQLWEHIRREAGKDFVWIDLKRGAKALRLALAVYSMQLVDDDPESSRLIRERIALARDWVEACAPYGEAMIWSDSDGEALVLNFTMGREE